MNRRNFIGGALAAAYVGVAKGSATTPVRCAGPIRPGIKWHDTDGKVICAQGGMVMAHHDVFYWCAIDRSCATGRDRAWHNGVVLYTSTDLAIWKNEGTIISASDDPNSLLHPERQLDRCNLLYNARTGKFVCWLHFLNVAGQCAAVYVADRPTGPWQCVRTCVQPNGMRCGDFGIAQATDGRAYLYFNRPHTMLAAVELTPDYTDTQGVCAVFEPRVGPPYTREAPTPFERNGLHYLLTSGTTHFYPNPTETIVSEGWTGPWKSLGELAPDDASHTTYHAQISQVLKVPSKKDLYVAIADRWLPSQTNLTYDAVRAAYDRAFKRPHDAALAARFDALTGGVIYPDRAPICAACSVWLPLAFRGDTPILEWRTSWSLDDFPNA